MFISEDDKKEILGKYQENISEEILNHLKRRFPVSKEIIFSEEPTPVTMIKVGEKAYFMEGHKTYLVNKLAMQILDNFPNESEKTIRRTIKFYLDFWKKFV